MGAFTLLLASLLLAAGTPSLPRHALFGAVVQDKASKATVVRVIPGSAAAKAGVDPGDVIVRLNGTAIGSTAAFLTALHALHAGDRATISLSRNGVLQEQQVTLGTPADESDPQVTTSYETIGVDGSLRRTLITTPKAATRPLPALLILGGIGCLSVDVAAFPEDPYLRLAHDVSRAGFVTMRVEKSGVGDSQGPPCAAADFHSEERAYAAALSALRSDKRVDRTKIFLFGHSIGSIEAPQLALAQPVAGIIVAEAVGRDWPEYEIRNLRRQLELSGEAPAAVDAALVEKQSCMTRLLYLMQSEAEIERTQPGCKTPNSVYPVDVSYMRQVAAIDAMSIWQKIAVPVLAIYGESDFITEIADHQRIVQVVNDRHAGYATLRTVSGMDHLLYRAATPKEAMDAYNSASARLYASQLSEVVVSWLKTKRPRMARP